MNKEEFDYDKIHIYFDVIKKEIKKSLDKDLSSYGLTGMHAMHLMMLYKCSDGLTLTDLTNKVCIDKANTTRAISDLIDKGYAIKSDDIRGFKVKLTEDGMKIAKHFHSEREKHAKSMFGEFTDKDKDDLMRLMDKILQGLKRMNESDK